VKNSSSSILSELVPLAVAAVGGAVIAVPVMGVTPLIATVAGVAIGAFVVTKLFGK
jgi:hypothetical protein